MKDINAVTLVCRLARDPELRHTPGGTAVCALRVAFSTSRKTDDGWQDKSNYMDVTVFGGQGEACATHLSKGRQIAVFGRLEWREWEAQDGSKRQAVEIVAEHVQFLSQSQGGDHSGNSGQTSADAAAGDFAPSGVGPDDDIPF